MSRVPPSVRSRIAHVLRTQPDTYAEVAERFGVCADTVFEIAKENGISRLRRWEDSEVEFLKENYWDHGARGCAAILGRNYQVVANKAGKLGLRTKIGPYGKWRVIDGGRDDGKP